MINRKHFNKENIGFYTNCTFRTFVLIFVHFFIITLHFATAQTTIEIKNFDSAKILRFSIGQDSSAIGCPLTAVKGKKNHFEIQCKRVFLAQQVLRTTCKLTESIIIEVQLELPTSASDSLEKKLSFLCASIIEIKNKDKITERLYSFVDGYRIQTKNIGKILEVRIFMRDEYSLVKNGNIEFVPFFGFDVGEPSSLLRGYDVRGPDTRFSFRPTSRVAGVQLYSHFVKLDKNGNIQSLHLMTDPAKKADSETLFSYFQKASKYKTKKKKNSVDNTIVFKNGYTLFILKEKENPCHFRFVKSNESSN